MENVGLNVLIIGENNCNCRISEYFSQKGFDISSLPDVYALRRLSGEVGSFVAHIKDVDASADVAADVSSDITIDASYDIAVDASADISADFVILTEQQAVEPVEIDGLVTSSIYEDIEVFSKKCADLFEPVVFLLDYVCESSVAATATALRNSALLARRKRKVFYLARFIRTAGRGIENLYREAREAGVTFVKYEDLCVTADLSTDEFSFFASDGEIKLDIRSKYVMSDGGYCTGGSYGHAIKALNLTTNKRGVLAEDKFFLTPVQTGRRGVFHMNRDVISSSFDEALEYIYSVINSGIWDDPSFGNAVIDGNKCVFCYNCYRACSHAALAPDHDASQMQCLSAACAGCGVCASLCPGNAITLERDDFAARGSCCDDFKRSLLLYCENSGGALLEDPSFAKSMSGVMRDVLAGVETLSVPCGGFLDTQRLLDGLNSYNRILCVFCPDDACKHFDGNKRACLQLSSLKGMLSTAGLESGNVSFVQISPGKPKVLEDELPCFFGGV